MIERAKPQTTFTLTTTAAMYTKIHNRAREISKHRNLCYHDTTQLSSNATMLQKDSYFSFIGIRELE
jgi:hypothetical protein